MAWTFHLIFGTVVGAALAAYVAARALRVQAISSTGMMWAVAGAAMVVGAASSHWGDRLWMRPSVFSGNEPPRSDLSALISMVIAICGVLAIVWGLLPHSLETGVKIVAQREQVDAEPALLVVPGVLGVLLFMSWRSGTIYVPWVELDRDESPGLFWFAWGSIALITVLMATRILGA